MDLSNTNNNNNNSNSNTRINGNGNVRKRKSKSKNKNKNKKKKSNVNLLDVDYNKQANWLKQNATRKLNQIKFIDHNNDLYFNKREIISMYRVMKYVVE